MSIPYRVQDYIAEHEVLWESVAHAPSSSCLEAARLAHVPADRLAKAVVLQNRAGTYLMAVIPANRKLDLARLRDALGDDVTLASENALERIFPDCEHGAVPPVGPAYGVATVWDEGLGAKRDVFFESGDHHTLVHVNGVDFSELMREAHALPPLAH